MATDEAARKTEALKRIAEANTELAKLQRARYQMLVEKCLPAYEDLRECSRGERGQGFDLGLSLLRLASGTFDASEFADQASAFELELAADSFSRQLRLHRKRIERTFDIFLSYNSEDRNEVRTITHYLETRGLLPWFAQTELEPGADWQSKLQDDIERVASCAVVVGRSGLGPWQRMEVNAALQLFVKRNLPVIPVLLPSCGVVPELPLFLHAVGWVDFRSLDPDPVEQLARAAASR